MDGTQKKEGRYFFAYLAAALAVTVGSAFAATRLFPAVSVCDPLAGCASAWDAALASGRALLPTLAAFVAVYVFAFSPFSIPASLSALCLYGAFEGTAVIAAAQKVAGVPEAAVAAALALPAVCLSVFAAKACALSPAARTVRFSGFEGRREAASLSLSFFTLSGAAALFLAVGAMILHFG